MLSRYLLASLLIVAFGCTKAEQPTPTTTPVSAAGVPKGVSDVPANEAIAPLGLTLLGPQAVTPNSDVKLTAVIKRNFASSDPIELTITLPTGTTLVGGTIPTAASATLRETIVDDQSTTITREVVIHIAAVPPADLIASVAVKGTDYGANATAAYRFGRPEPKLAQPIPDNGPAMGAKGKSFGTPISGN